MSETLLDIVQAAYNEMQLNAPVSVVGNSTDDNALGMLSIANSVGRDLVRKFEWGALITPATFPTVAGQSDYPLPSDFYRMVNDTSWDTSTNWQMSGPITPQAEQYIRDSQVGFSKIYRQFRQIGNRTIRITPTPPDSTGIIVFQYLSKNWVVSATATATSFLTDQDTTVFDFDLMVKQCKWRWRSSKGYDAAEFKAEADEALAALMAADQGGTVLNMTPWSDRCEGGEAYALPNYGVTTTTTPVGSFLSDDYGNPILTDGGLTIEVD